MSYCARKNWKKLAKDALLLRSFHETYIVIEEEDKKKKKSKKEEYDLRKLPGLIHLLKDVHKVTMRVWL